MDRLHIHLSIPVPAVWRWRPHTILTSPADYAEHLADPDPRVHYAGPLSAWKMPNDIGFAVGRRSFHLGRDW